MTGDIRDVVLKLLVQDRNFDFSRTFIDVASKDNGYLGLKELLPPEQWPYFLDDTIPDSSIAISELGVEKLVGAVLQKHIQLHRSGAISLSITRFGVMVDKLEALGLPFVYILPSREYVVNFCLEVINSVNSGRSREQLIGAIAMCFPEAEARERERLMARAGKLAVEFAASNGFDFTPSFEKDALVILTHRRDIAAMSSDFSESGFRGQLLPEKTTALIGLGSGRSIFQAKRNSLSALEISRNNCDRIYLVDEENEVSGPLGSAKNALVRVPDEDILHVAERLGLDHVYIQKIMSFAKLGNTDRVSADELADYLEVTVRTANRILTRILQSGGARVYEENVGGGRGRPRKFYELTFLEDGWYDGRS
jgi:hypothetical protein